MRLVLILQLNDPDSVAVRVHYLELLALWLAHPDDTQLARFARVWFSYPDDLPDLSRCRAGNSRPEGIERSYFRLRERNELPEIYSVGAE